MNETRYFHQNILHIRITQKCVFYVTISVGKIRECDGTATHTHGNGHANTNSPMVIGVLGCYTTMALNCTNIPLKICFSRCWSVAILIVKIPLFTGNERTIAARPMSHKHCTIIPDIYICMKFPNVNRRESRGLVYVMTNHMEITKQKHFRCVTY